MEVVHGQKSIPYDVLPNPLLVTADPIFTEYNTAFQWTIILSLGNVLHTKIAHKQIPITKKEAPQLEEGR